MIDLAFHVERVEPEPHAAEPVLRFRLRLGATGQTRAVRAMHLQCQIRIEPARRSYTGPEKERLLDLFGTPERWGQTVRDFLWTHVSVSVPAFEGGTSLDLPVASTFDFNVGATKYFDALGEGAIPLRFLFSGTLFLEGDDGALRIAQIPWDREAAFSLPVAVWKEMMALHYPNTVWLSLRKDVFDRLNAHRMRRCLPTWEHALEELLASALSSSEKEKIARLAP